MRGIFLPIAIAVVAVLWLVAGRRSVQPVDNGGDGLPARFSKRHGGSRPRRPTTRRWGIRIGSASLVGLPIAGVMVLATANACGMFGDGCEEYGHTGGGFGLALAALCLCVAGAVAGLVLVLVSYRRP